MVLRVLIQISLESLFTKYTNTLYIRKNIGSLRPALTMTKIRNKDPDLRSENLSL